MHREDHCRGAAALRQSGVHLRAVWTLPSGEKWFVGDNGTVARQAMNLNVAYRLTGDERYRATMLDAINYLFGRNPFGRSFVTGLGNKPPMFPHDRRSGADKVVAPWPGYLVGGAWPTATDWFDDQENYQTNEIAINWNGALIYALSRRCWATPIFRPRKSIRMSINSGLKPCIGNFIRELNSRSDAGSWILDTRSVCH